MLLEFKTSNYKSFVDEADFVMSAAPKQKGLDYSVCRETISGKGIRGLCSSVIYGPNASGKTNLIGAMDVLRSIVLRGNIRNTKEVYPPNSAATTLELIPNNQLEEEKPVEFTIEFTESGMRIRYELCARLGQFADASAKRRVQRENLYVNGIEIFERTDSIKSGNLKPIKNYLNSEITQLSKDLQQLADASLDEEELFLMNGFRVVFSASFAKMFADWFTDKFMVICRADSIQSVGRFSDPQNAVVYVEKTTNEAAKLFGINSNAVGYVKTEIDSDARLCSLFKNRKNGKNYAIAADVFESYGTVRFINIFPLVLKAIMTGSVLVADEFDASIHPMALMSIINVFHNDDINKKHAQLIFNTHNPIFLNSNIFRRDEIKFVERDEHTNQSVLYALSDFGTSGDKGVRQHEDYMKNYFVGRYGAIRDIDFTPVFEELLAVEVSE